jgi:AraC-like DNA-binding protein
VDPIEKAVWRAITAMQDNLGEALTVDDMARAAMFSKFHFTRIFQRVTGVSPRRFLSALRLQRAKHLLLSTSLTVADISTSVGYSSVGTFSSRFSRSVGLSPTRYRRLRGFAPHISSEPRRPAGRERSARVCGSVSLPRDEPGNVVFIGLFRGPIPEGRPARCAVLPGPGWYQLVDVPQGSWYVLAQSTEGDAGGHIVGTDSADRPVSVATYGPVTVRADTIVRADLRLRPMRMVDPPVLLALLDARTLALATVAEEAAQVPAVSLAGAVARAWAAARADVQPDQSAA